MSWVRRCPDLLPDASPVLPRPDALPSPHIHTSTFVAGVPHFTYTYGSLNDQHALRLSSQGSTIVIAPQSDDEARRLLQNLEQAARELRRRLYSSSDA